MPAPKKQIDRRKCDWSMNHDTFNHMTYYAHAWEENQWEGVPIFEKKTNGKKTWAYRTCCICTLFQRPFSRYYVTKRNLHIEHQTHVFFSGNSQLNSHISIQLFEPGPPLVSLLPERTETVRGMGQTKLAVQIHIFITSSTAQGGGGSFKIGNLWERLVVVNQGWQSEATDGLKGAWSLSLFLSLSLTIYLPTYLFSMYLSIDLSISLSLSSNYPIYLSIYLSLFHLSICLAVYLSIYLSVCLSVYLSTCLSVVQCHSVYCSVM